MMSEVHEDDEYRALEEPRSLSSSPSVFYRVSLESSPTVSPPSVSVITFEFKK